MILAPRALGYRAGGLRLALFCAAALALHRGDRLLGRGGGTLASVLVAVPLSVAVGLFVGICGIPLGTVRRSSSRCST